MKNKKWGTRVEKETRRRIRLSLYAYAYEFELDSIVSDEEFDIECLLVDLSIDTTNKELDRFFRKHFSPDTGMWIHKHPHLDVLRKIYKTHYEI